MFEQDNLSTLASFVFFSKVDIVKMILKDPETIGKCLVDLKNPQTPAKRQAELCGFLKGIENLRQGCRMELRFTFMVLGVNAKLY